MPGEGNLSHEQKSHSARFSHSAKRVSGKRGDSLLDFVEMTRRDQRDGHPLPLESEHLLPAVLLLLARNRLHAERSLKERRGREGRKQRQPAKETKKEEEEHLLRGVHAGEETFHAASSVSPYLGIP